MCFEDVNEDFKSDFRSQRLCIYTTRRPHKSIFNKMSISNFLSSSLNDLLPLNNDRNHVKAVDVLKPTIPVYIAA